MKLSQLQEAKYANPPEKDARKVIDGIFSSTDTTANIRRFKHFIKGLTGGVYNRSSSSSRSYVLDVNTSPINALSKYFGLPKQEFKWGENYKWEFSMGDTRVVELIYHGSSNQLGFYYHEGIRRT